MTFLMKSRFWNIANQPRDDHFGIKTKYEKMFSDKGEKINYQKFRFKS